MDRGYTWKEREWSFHLHFLLYYWELLSLLDGVGGEGGSRGLWVWETL